MAGCIYTNRTEARLQLKWTTNFRNCLNRTENKAISKFAIIRISRIHTNISSENWKVLKPKKNKKTLIKFISD